MAQRSGLLTHEASQRLCGASRWPSLAYSALRTAWEAGFRVILVKSNEFMCNFLDFGGFWWFLDVFWWCLVVFGGFWWYVGGSWCFLMGFYAFFGGFWCFFGGFLGVFGGFYAFLVLFGGFW